MSKPIRMRQFNKVLDKVLNEHYEEDFSRMEKI